MTENKPEILAPAGTTQSFLAAIAAGADAVFCGLKSFSARMEAKNFSVEELSKLTKLAHNKGVKVYVTLNSLVKPDELGRIKREFSDLIKYVSPDAVIVQDLSFVKLAKELNFKGEVHISTLFNQTFGKGLEELSRLGVKRVVLPRELSVDEIKDIAGKCNGKTDLEVFIHGALCYGISGRCYWSSFLGGKSGLRGRCVQPCRRIYEQKADKLRLFSCQDLSLDVLVKVLKEIPEVKTWKIEGRKKGPHYVYYTVLAYKMLRDEGHIPEKKKTALGLLSQSLGRESTHYNFLSQRPQNPVDTKRLTASGKMMGVVRGGAKAFVVPREMLLKGDLLRIGYEDEKGHTVYKVTINVPKKGKLFLGKLKGIRNDTPVFLIDRREAELENILRDLEKELNEVKTEKISKSKDEELKLEERTAKHPVFDLNAYRKHGKVYKNSKNAVWLSFDSLKSIPKSMMNDYWFILPPVIWPENEETFSKLCSMAVKWGARNFILNAPAQTAFFQRSKDKLNLWAGPFCNISNVYAIDLLSEMGFDGVFVSPELSEKDYISLGRHSSLPLGIIIEGHFPLTIARTIAPDLKLRQNLKSPMGEELWVEKRGSEYWLFPNWKLDLKSKRDKLQSAGYKIFLHLNENVPKDVNLKTREGLWNWNLILK